MTILVLAFALKVYAWRRWREARRALDACVEALESLRASEARLGLLTRQLPAFLWTTDADLRLTSFAGGAYRRAGIDPRGRVGRTVAEFFGTDDPAFPPLAAHRRALAGEPTTYALRRDGAHHEIRVEPLRDEAGRIVGTLGLGLDVTERERAAAALRDSEARFHAVFEGAAIGIGLTDLQRRPLMVNPALARLTGRDRAELAGRGFPHPTHPADAARDAALFAELVAGARDHYQLEKRYVRADGGLAWGRLTTSLVRDAAGEPRYVIGMVEDITARVAAEAALRAREARYRAVVEQAAEGIVLFEAGSKRIVEANPALLRMLGYAEADLATLTIYDLVAHDRASVAANTDYLVREECNAIGERDYRRKDGTTVPVEVHAVALTLDCTPLVCVVVRDITARRAAAGERAAARRRLAAAREAERLAVARELHDEVIQDLLGVRLALQLRRRAIRSETADPALAALLDEGEQALGEVVGRLRRIVSGLRPAGLEELGLSAALAGYVAHVCRKEAGTGLAIDTDLDTADTDLPAALARALFGMAREGLRNVRRHAGARRVTVTLRLVAGVATLRVADDGRGFDVPPKLPHLARGGHFGLVGIAEQLADLGGR